MNNFRKLDIDESFRIADLIAINLRNYFNIPSFIETCPLLYKEYSKKIAFIEDVSLPILDISSTIGFFTNSFKKQILEKNNYTIDCIGRRRCFGRNK